MQQTRRSFCFALAGGSAASLALSTRNADAARGWAGLEEELAQIEAASGGRLGVAVLDARSEARAGRRADERFPMLSTFKLLAAAAVLERVDRGQERLDRRIAFGPADLVVNSRTTSARVAEGGMTLGELCEAAMTVSDNTAGNLLLGTLEGPAGLTRFARSLGDEVSRLDRWEPELNEARPGDLRDTTTPNAMAGNIRRLVLGDVLSPASRDQLLAWLVGNKTGDARLRARLPRGWRVGDKTGTGDNGTTNDVGLLWPREGGGPVIVSAYLTGSPHGNAQQNAAVAAVGEAVARAWDA